LPKFPDGFQGDQAVAGTALRSHLPSAPRSWRSGWTPRRATTYPTC